LEHKQGHHIHDSLEVGASTQRLSQLNEQDTILDVAGPLGIPSEIKKYNMVCVVGGGVGAALLILLLGRSNKQAAK
jgi:ferredoxin--NADP+ reductase